MLTYKIAAKYQKGPETVLAKFDKMNDAKAYIQDKLQDDANMKVMVIYNLYELGELIASFDQSALESDASGGQQQSSGQRFSPNPLQTNLRPAGGMPNNWVDDSEKKE